MIEGERPAPRVLALAGWGRSGSTLLGNLLGSARDVFHAGELGFFWGRGVLGGQLCSCGLPVPECPLWSEVLKRVVGTAAPAEFAGRIQAQLGPAIRTRRLVFQREVGEVGVPVRSAVRSLYEAVQAVTGARLIVDGSKLPLYVEVLAQSDLELATLPLVRDPRAVAFSWGRVRHNPGTGRPMVRHSALRSSLAWVLTNSAIDRLRGRTEAGVLPWLRYEDFVSAGEKVLDSCLRFGGLSGGAELLGRAAAEGLEAGHSVAGNPMRFRRGPVQLRLDDEWRLGLGKIQRLTVETVCRNQMKTFGYLPSHAGPEA